MVPIFKHLACLLVMLSIYPALFLVSIIIQYAKTSFPPGIDQPFKLRIYQTLLISFLLLGLSLEKLKLCSLLDVLRILDYGMPSFRDSAVLIQEQQFDGIPVKVYQPKKPASTKRKGLLFFHGGAGTYGTVDSYQKVLRHFTKEADAVIVAVAYGLGPENPYPNQYTECLKATQYFMRNAEQYQVDVSRISVCGDSCGANFATRICQLLVDRTDLPKIQAQILMYPGLQGMDFYLPSYQQNKNIPFLWRDLVVYYTCRFLNKNTSYLKDVVESCHVPDDIQKKYRKWVAGDLIPEEFKVRGYTPRDPALRKFKPPVYEEMKQILEVTFSPLFAEDTVISKLPPACILTCEFDVLRDDGLLYKRRLEENGVPVTWFHAEKSTHAMAILFGYGPFSVPSSKWIVDKITDFVKGL